VVEHTAREFGDIHVVCATGKLGSSVPSLGWE
jgi:hypothetical protein